MTDTNEIEICEASEWSAWGECTKSCGGGIQYSTRYALNDGYNEHDCGGLTRSRVCNENLCPTPVVVFLKNIDYKEVKFKGWTDEEVNSYCDKNNDITKISDTLVLYHDANDQISEEVELNPSTNDQFYETFYISTQGEWVWVNNKFIKIKNRQIVDVMSCELGNNQQILEVKNQWCGNTYTEASYICLTGTRETDDTFRTPLADRYYYRQHTQSLKTEWVSRNNLLKICYIHKNDKNNYINKNIWALSNGSKIFYYTIEFEEVDQCPPQHSVWVPVLPMNSNNVNLVMACSETDHSNLSCDLKDSFLENWIELDQSKKFHNFEKNLTNHSDLADIQNNYIEVLQRGAGLQSGSSDVYAQSIKGYFKFNELVTHPVGIGVKNYLESEETEADIKHEIEFPLTKVLDVTQVKLMSIMGISGSFDLQMFSLKTQSWVKLKTITHFENNQQIVTTINNENYNSSAPPHDGSDILHESISALRIFYGNYNYESDISEPHQDVKPGQGLMIYSFRVEARDSVKCRASEINYLTDRPIYQVVETNKQETPKFYETYTEIVGDPCVGNTLYGNYKYTGLVNKIRYEWYVNDSLTTDSRHIETLNLSSGDFLKFKVFFDYDGNKTKMFEATTHLRKCATKLYPVNDNFADFNLNRIMKDGDNKQLVGFDWPETACSTDSTSQIRFYWNGNLKIGKQVSTLKDYQTNEQINPGLQYFVCLEENCIIKIDVNLVIVEIISCPPDDFEIKLSKEFPLSKDSKPGTIVGTLESKPVNKNVKYFMNNNEFGIHNNLFKLHGADSVNNLQNINLILNNEINKIGSIAKISVHARNDMDIGFVEKNFTINILDTELIRYAPCPRISVQGFNTELLNGNYGLIYNETSAEGHEVGYEYMNSRLVYRTNRQYTNGFILLNGTVEFGAGYFYTKLSWSDIESRWELRVFSDETSVDENINYDYKLGKLCAFSEATATDCPVNLNLVGISVSFGNGTSVETGIVDFGDDYFSDCSKLSLC
jgi:hypothetical protein